MSFHDPINHYHKNQEKLIEKLKMYEKIIRTLETKVKEEYNE